MKKIGKSKTYDFVPIVPICERNKSISYRKYDARFYNGKLVLKIKALAPLHIGTGKISLDRKMKEDTMEFVGNRKGKIIPGSSLKGAFRSVAEAISCSCAPKKPQELKENFLPERNRFSCSFKNAELCPACSIFGMISGGGKNENTLAYKGKVQFRDFRLIKGQTGTMFFPDTFGKKDEKYWEHYLEPPVDTKSDRKRIKGRKFYYSRETEDTYVMQVKRKKGKMREVVRPGAFFEGEVVFQNMTREEMGLLLYSLDINHDFIMKLGYGKNLGCGKVQIDLLEVQPRETGFIPEETMEMRYTTEHMRELAEEYREKALEKDGLRQAVLKFEEIMEDNRYGKRI